MQDALKQALKDGTLTLPEPFSAQLRRSWRYLRKLAGRLEIKNADERRQVKTRQAVLQSAEFKALWDRIKHKTTYRVQFDNEKLVESCIKALREGPAHRQDPPAMAQGRPRHRQGRRGSDGDRRAPHRSSSTKPTSNCPTCSPTSRTRPSSPAAASIAS